MSARQLIQLCVERDRLIYWLLRAEGELETEYTANGIRAVLKAFGYPSDGERAKQLLALGEPGTYLSLTSSWLPESKEKTK